MSMIRIDYLRPIFPTPAVVNSPRDVIISICMAWKRQISYKEVFMDVYIVPRRFVICTAEVCLFIWEMESQIGMK